MLICCMLPLYGCGDSSLSRKEAKRLIVKHGGFPSDVTHTLRLRGSLGIAGVGSRAEKYAENYKTLIEQGFLKGEVSAPAQDWPKIITVGVILADKGKQYATGAVRRYSKNDITVPVARCTVVVEEVTGIIQEESQAQVEFEYHLEPTPFSIFGDLCPPGRKTVWTREAYFSLYDDGWRIEDI